jgi:hypothetical protein
MRIKCRLHPGGSIETRSRPRLLAATRHGFTFYVADPVSSIREQAAVRSSRAASQCLFPFALRLLNAE